MRHADIVRATLSQEITLSGRGLHGGTPIEMCLRPGHAGVRFFAGKDMCEARPGNVADTKRSTNLECACTIEHLMSALSGLGVTDVDVHLYAANGEPAEVPAMDGSALPFYISVGEAGLDELGSTRIPFPDYPVRFSQGDTTITIDLGAGKWCYQYESSELWPHRGEALVANIATNYLHCVAPARTFLRESELATLDERGLARGIDRATALVIGKEGPISDPRMPNELVTHKLLDLIGDIYLVGIPARYLDVFARKSGHATNVASARMLWRLMVQPGAPG